LQDGHGPPFRRRPELHEGIYAIGCRHVFGLALILNPAVNDATIKDISGTTALAQATDHAGTLANGVQYSFDGQLAEVSNQESLLATLGNVTYASRALGWDDVTATQDCWILTPHGPVAARYKGQHVDPLEYTLWLNDIRHRALLRFIVSQGGVHAGDSGSPVMSARGGGMLLGMLIAADSSTYAVAIPAWELLQPDNYNLQEGPWDFWPVQP
jgi:hypothetical protein